MSNTQTPLSAGDLQQMLGTGQTCVTLASNILGLQHLQPKTSESVAVP